MRSVPLLEALFPEVRTGILLATLLQPDRTWFLSELAGFLQTRVSSLQREVEALTGAGLLRSWRDGRRLYVQVDRQCPIFEDLQRLLEKTGGLVPVLTKELSELSGQLRIAFIFGSVARSQERTASDIDLLVVGEAGLKDLQPVLQRVEKHLGRQINPVVFSVAEFQSRMSRQDHFLTSVMDEPRILIAGDEIELAAVA